MFEEKRGNAAFLFKHSGFYFVRDPEPILDFRFWFLDSTIDCL